MGPSGGGNSKSGLVYMGALTQDGNTGNMNKSITCKGYSSYLVIAGLVDGSHEKATITATSGTVERTMQDETTVYSSYLNKTITDKPAAVVWEIKDCTKGDTTITIQCPGYYWLAFFVYGVT